MATESQQDVSPAQASKAARLNRAPAGRPGKPHTASVFDQLPPSLFTSPGVYAGCGAFVLLYGLVFFAVMSQEKQRRLEAMEQARLHPPPRVEMREVAAAAPGTPPIEPAAKSRAASSPAPSTNAAKPNDAAPQPVANKPDPPTPQPAPPKPAPTAVASVSTKPTDVKPVITPKPAPAPPPPPAPSPAAAPANSFAGLGAWIDPRADCPVQKDAKGLTVNVPGSLHLLSPELKELSAPRSLAAVEGDFTLQVTVAGKIQPGTTPLDKMPVTFQGAGILLWQDANNYIRYERAVLNSAEQPMVSQLLIDSCKDGMPGSHSERKMANRTITLRMERRADAINCLYSSDGKTWISLKRFNPTLSSKVSVGISASNLSPRPFPARFEDFSLVK